ncbi:MAG: hypothetical protein AB9873_00735 [Syntrophobacteraceae bacterium]
MFVRPSVFKGSRRYVPIVIFLLASTLLYCPAQAAPAAAKFEVPVAQKASAILPQQLMSGPHYRVREQVPFFGYMHHYVVDSDFGMFRVTGDMALRKLIREIGAIASLKEVRKGEAYVNGVKKAASQSLEFGANVLTDPVDTISGIPKGVARLFGNVTTGMTTKAGPGEDSKVKQALAVSSNKRELASKLGVDVYSSNSVLQEELNGVAWATAIGSLSLSAALAPIGGPAVTAVSLTRMSQQLNDLLKDYPPQRLREINQQKLEAMGVSSGLASRFLDHQAFTATQDTVIVNSLEALSGAKGRDAFIQQALTADDEESANFFMQIAEMMKGYQAKVAPIREISVSGPLVFAKASSGAVLIPLPLDRAIWTERASERVPAAMSAYKAANPGSKKFDVWITGVASKMVKDEMAKHGGQVVENVDNRIAFVF